MRELSWSEVKKIHSDTGLSGLYKIYEDNTKTMIEPGYIWEEILDHHNDGGKFGKKISIDDFKWIPLYEYLPEEGSKVWVTVENHGGDRRCEKSVFRDGSFWANRYVVYDPLVKAWMPRFVPEPYDE